MSELPSFKAILRVPSHLLALGFGSGLLPKAPGTWGSLLALPLYVLVFPQLSIWVEVALLLISFLLGVYLCGKTANDFGVHDHGAIVWDEFVGQWLVLFYLWRFTDTSWPLAMVLGFLLFRLFDVLKPWPIRWADRKLAGGFGIMFDDVLAAAMAVVVLYLLSATSMLN